VTVDDFAAFAQLLKALRPWLDSVVIAGGWAHRLHRFHPMASPPAYGAIRTNESVESRAMVCLLNFGPDSEVQD
jgi:hypothetical protein